jgi:hypothetical protein
MQLCNDHLMDKHFFFEQVMSKVHSICSSFGLLADESRDLFPAEKKINVGRADKIHKMTIIDKNGQKLLF